MNLNMWPISQLIESFDSGSIMFYYNILHLLVPFLYRSPIVIELHFLNNIALHAITVQFVI